MLKIKISAAHPSTLIDGASARSQIDEAMAALGFIREVERVSIGEAMSTASGPSDDMTPETPKLEPARGRGRPKKEAPAAPEPTPVAPAVEPPAAETPQISANPENRVEPPKPVEQAPAADAVTHDGLRGLLGKYRDRFGLPAALEDGPKIIGFAKISEIPEDKLPQAHKAMADAIEADPFQRNVLS